MMLRHLAALAAALALFLPAPASIAQEPTIVTYRVPQSNIDQEQDYSFQVLKMALDRTVETHGEYELVPSHKDMTTPRMLQNLREQAYVNPLMKLSATDEYCEEFLCIPFPVDLGLVGYRVFLTHEGLQEEISQVTTLEQLQEYLIGQGLKWLDVPILEHNGFRVYEVSSYESLFQMVAEGRLDLFPRGVNEIHNEWGRFGHLEGLALEESLMLFYPLPRFFITYKGNEELAQRVLAGLEAAYEDGSILALWKDLHGRHLDLEDLASRRLFVLENPYIRTLDPSYQQYFLNPME